jgi:membrane-bound lytic murein transglycosylase B
MKKRLYTIVSMVIIMGILIPFIDIVAQTTLPPICTNPQTAEQKKQCDALRAEIEQLARDEKKLSEQRAISGSLSQEVAKLTAEINKKKNDIAAKNKTLQQLSGQINEKVKTIQTLETKRQQQERSLAEILRRKHQFDDNTLVEIMLSKKTLSEFLYEVDQLETINQGIQESFEIIQSTKQQTSKEKETLEERRNRENDVKYALEAERKSVEITQSEKNRTLQVSRGQEQNYAAVVRDRQARIASIRAELIRFQGSGVESRSISFGEAYDYAKKASEKTGIRVAFILAIMQQETNFGNNVGGCYLKNGETAAGIYIRTGNPSQRNMVPGNFENFKKITASLGLDWQTTPISCALVRADGTLFGHGGAMGYTQFIPNTWMSVEARVRQFTGASVANPWNPEHAVMATAVFLRDLGAQTQTYSAEHNAACRYYGACSTYANSVMSKAAAIQQTINQLEQLNR